MNVFDELRWRGIVYDATPDAEEALGTESLKVYVGFDPTADSLHVGSLLPLMGLARLQRAGHTPIAIVGGGTGMIGDPSGKSQERILLDQEQVERNVEGLRTQIARFLDFERPDNPAMLVNNADWLASISLVDFLRDTGKYFTVNYMMAKESVKRRLDSEDGLSFTEFSYMLLQAHDFLVLYDRYGCKMQMGGSDQWGNILAGADLVRRLRSDRVHGIVFPLVVTAGGTKFGKTEEGTIWLDSARTSPYKFYQFWLNTDDRDVLPYLRFFTWLGEEEISALETELLENPGNRSAQIRLAEEVTRVVHGSEELEKAQAASSVLFGGEVSAMRAADLMEVFEDVPSTEMERAVFDESGIDIVQLISDAGLVASRGEARRLVRGGGINVNNRRIKDENHRVSLDDAIEQRILVLRRGQKTYRLVKIV
ncbi:MAG: tyrosine--tRNA ligase [Rhodothermales bacterium]|nr:tyrosine--tRNA ligase [Rhodothermales bacterium]